MLATGLYAERQPSYARRTQQRELAHLNRVHPCISPDVQFRRVGLGRQKLTDTLHMTVIQDEHLIDDFVSLDTVHVIEAVNFMHDAGGVAHAVAIHSEWRVDATERTFEGAA